MLPFGFVVGCGVAPCPPRSRGRTMPHLRHRRRGRHEGSLRSTDSAGPVDCHQQEPNPQRQLHPDGPVGPSPALSRCLPTTEVISHGAGEGKECTAEPRREHFGIGTAQVRRMWRVLGHALHHDVRKVGVSPRRAVTQRPLWIQCIQPSSAPANVLSTSWTCLRTIAALDEATWEASRPRRCPIIR
jgi:hypothetical protein